MGTRLDLASFFEKERWTSDSHLEECMFIEDILWGREQLLEILL